jgi:tetratricopeptide (TPR) repeat protein
LSTRLSLFKTATLFTLLGILIATSTGIAQPLSKVAQSSLDIAYRLAGGNMTQWAATAFQDASRAAPESVEARLLGGMAWYVIGKEMQAIELWREAEALGEEAASSLLGDVMFHQGDIAGAQAAYERALATLPRAAKARFGLAMIAEKKDDLNGAIEHLEQLIEPPSGDEAELYVPMIDAYYHLGRLYLADDRPAEAQKVLKVGTQLNSHHPGMHLMLAMAYEKNGLLAESVHLYERALQLDPNSQAAKEGLQRLHR